MIIFPNCKINLGLNITRKRDDGYHDLETVFYPLYLKDCLEVVQAAEFNFQSSGLEIKGGEQNNLCIKAYNLLKKNFPHIPAVQIHLHKVIPMGAGLGGGSSDAAFMLMLLNKKFTLGLQENELLEYAMQLGSDCPVFIINKPSFATGRGEEMEQIDIDLSGYNLVLINPGIHVSTAEAFAKLTPNQPKKSLKEIIEQPIETWKEDLKNDFEEGVFQQYQPIKKIKELLYKSGAVYTSMTGTGSSVYGMFKSDIPALDFPPNYFVFKQSLA